MTTRLIAEPRFHIRPLCLSVGLFAFVAFMATNAHGIGKDGSGGTVTNKATWFEEIPPDQNRPLGTHRIATDESGQLVFPFPGTNNWCSNCCKQGHLKCFALFSCILIYFNLCLHRFSSLFQNDLRF